MTSLTPSFLSSLLFKLRLILFKPCNLVRDLAIFFPPFSESPLWYNCRLISLRCLSSFTERENSKVKLLCRPVWPKSKCKLFKFVANLIPLTMEVAPSSLILFFWAEYPPKFRWRCSNFLKFSKALPQALAPSSFTPLY